MIELSETSDDQLEPGRFGRVGYGELARFSPALLAIVMIAAVAVIAFSNRDQDGNTRDIIGQMAPNVVMTDFDGNTTLLSSLTGNVVVLNFWAAWCEPCKSEMPAFQTIHSDDANDVRIVGVDIRTDKDADAARLLSDLGITYQIVKDDDASIEKAFGLGGSYPVTVFISPEGKVNSIRIGQMTETEIRDSIADARGD